MKIYATIIQKRHDPSLILLHATDEISALADPETFRAERDACIDSLDGDYVFLRDVVIDVADAALAPSLFGFSAKGAAPVGAVMQ